MRNKVTVALLVLCISIGAAGATAPLANAKADHLAGSAPTNIQTPYGPAQVLRTPGGFVTIYNTAAVLAHPGVRAVTAVKKSTNWAIRRATGRPDAPIDDGVDTGGFWIALEWVYNQGTFLCGDLSVETESTSGPATGNMQAELHVVVTNQYTANPWNFDQDFVNGLGAESGCYDYHGTINYWVGEGSGALQWPDGNQASSGNQYVDAHQP